MKLSMYQSVKHMLGQPLMTYPTNPAFSQLLAIRSVIRILYTYINSAILYLMITISIREPFLIWSLKAQPKVINSYYISAGREGVK